MKVKDLEEGDEVIIAPIRYPKGVMIANIIAVVKDKQVPVLITLVCIQ